MTTDTVLLSQEGPIARVVLNNPARLNAISMAMWEAMGRIFDSLAADPAIRVVVISGAGGKAFSAGADISEFEERHTDAAAVVRNTERDAIVADKLARLDKPTIAEIAGYCMGGSVAFALCCDLRICSEDSRFAIPPAKLGHCYSPAGIERVMNTVGLANTREILYTARQFSAREAFEMGLVNRVVPRAELAGYVRNYAETIAQNAPLTIGAVKRITAELMKEAPQRDIALCNDLVARCFASEDHKEGRHAFMEKRRPVFTGR